MLALSTFTARCDNSELRIRKAKLGQVVGTHTDLPIANATGTLDPIYSPKSGRPPAIGFEDDVSKWDVLEPLRLIENVDYEFSVQTPWSKAEFGRRWSNADNRVWPFANMKLQNAIIFSSSDACQEIGGRYRITGHLRFDNQLGGVDLSLAPDVCPIQLRAEVITEKIDYEHDFYRLLDELDKVHHELILQLDAPTEVSLDSLNEDDLSPHSTILHLRRILHSDALPHAVATILGNPVSRIESHRENEMTAFVTMPDWMELQSRPHVATWMSGGPLAAMFQGVTPVTLPTRRTERSFDTRENRYVKFALGNLLELLREVQRHLDGSHVTTTKQIRNWTVLIEEMLLHPFWLQIGICTVQPSSMVFYERSGYRDFIQAVNDLELSLSMVSRLDAVDPTSGDLRPVWELYEFWCFLQLREVLSSIAGTDGTPGLSSVISRRKVETTIQSGDPGKTRFSFACAGNNVEVDLYFTRWSKPELQSDGVWLETYSTALHPDFSIRISSQGISHWVHFDAKYRVGLPNSAGRPRSHRADDVHKMHAYRDAILGTRGSYVLFPGDSTSPTIYVRHASETYRTSFPGPSVGAFPLCPSDASTVQSQRDALTLHLRSIIEAAATHSSYQEEDGWI
ncbi:MAG: DUF2357 domain-containing protein [Rhodopirellula sp.]|nr:DUF2357 domain-containing protein [Rhodopirellula sp.]